jgi:hypothetical protein
MLKAAAVACLALAARNAAAEIPAYVVDPARSQVVIHVGRAGFLQLRRARTRGPRAAT